MTYEAPPRPRERPRPGEVPAPRTGSSRRVSARREAEQRRLRRCLLFLGATLVLPGSVQLATGARRVGLAALGAWLTTVAAALLLLATRPAGLAVQLAVRPWALLLVQVLAAVLAAGWAALLVHAWLASRPDTLARQHRPLVLLLTGALVLSVAAPAYAVRHYTEAQRHLLGQLFPDGAAARASDGRLNVLLLGGDSAETRVGLRTDSVNLVSVDVASGRSVMVGLPRNLTGVRFPDGTPLAARFPDGFTGEGDPAAYFLNAVYTFGAEHPDLLPGAQDPGAEAVKQAVAGTLGLDVHYYVLVDLAGFRSVVDALGGVTIRLTEDVPYGLGGGVLEAGLRKLSGSEALWYARSRTGTSDYIRMQRQRCVLGAVLEQVDPGTLLRRFDEIATTAAGVVSTDVPRSALAQLAGLALDARAQQVTTLQLTPPLVDPEAPDLDALREAVRLVLSGGQASAARPARVPDPAATGAAPDPAAEAPAEEAPAQAELRNDVGGASQVQATCSYR